MSSVRGGRGDQSDAISNYDLFADSEDEDVQCDSDNDGVPLLNRDTGGKHVPTSGLVLSHTLSLPNSPSRKLSPIALESKQVGMKENGLEK